MSINHGYWQGWRKKPCIWHKMSLTDKEWLNRIAIPRIIFGGEHLGAISHLADKDESL